MKSCTKKRSGSEGDFAGMATDAPNDAIAGDLATVAVGRSPIGDAAGKISKASGKIEANARKARRAVSTWRASAFVDLLGRLVGR